MIDSAQLLDTFMALVQIDSPSGQEAAIAAALADRLHDLDMEVVRDAAGNVLARWDGEGRPLLLSAHMDTVAPGTGIHPVVADGLICSDGTTILGGDDKSGVAVILQVLTALHERGRLGRIGRIGRSASPSSHASRSSQAVEVAFSVQEEVGLHGAKAMDMGWFRAREALVLDAGGPLNRIVCAAPSSDKIDVIVHGRAAHAGSNPEDGINAIRLAAQAIAAMPLGRIDAETTANIGVIRGGEAVNVVPDRVEMYGEARSHDVRKLDAQIAAMRGALQDAVDACPGAGLEVDVRRTYVSYRLSEQSPLVQRIVQALRDMGEEEPAFHITGGGSDANIFNAAGITAIPVSTGMQSVHTNQECITLAAMVRCAELVLRVLGAWSA